MLSHPLAAVIGLTVALPTGIDRRRLGNGRLSVKGYINDICPGDGFAAVLEIEVSYNGVTACAP
jgi:hypothetical protein